MLILALETSCDETAAAVLKTTSNAARLLSNLVASQVKLHAKTGGVVPEVAARAHIQNIIPLIKRALIVAKITLNKIDVIAITAGPGLAPALLVGVDTAKTLAFGLAKPIVAINHIEAHIFSPFLQAASCQLPAASSVFPAISLVVSGGHTELFLVRDWLRYKKLGSTLDDAAGECFDKCAKMLGLPYPGGPALAQLAQRGSATIAFPRPLMNSKNFNFSFSGLKTAVLYYLRDNALPPLKLRGGRALWKTDIAASAQAAIVDVLVCKTLIAEKKYKVKTVLLGGGVAANLLLRRRLQAIPAKLLIARPEFCTDNAAMIAFTGWLHARKKRFTPLNKVRANADWEI